MGAWGNFTKKIRKGYKKDGYYYRVDYQNDKGEWIANAECVQSMTGRTGRFFLVYNCATFFECERNVLDGIYEREDIYSIMNQFDMKENKK